MVKKQLKDSSSHRNKVRTKLQSIDVPSPNQIKEIKLDNLLSIDKSQELKKMMMEVLKESNEISLTATRCEIIDLSAIQLLYSSYLTAQKENKKISVDLIISDEQKDLLRNAGIYHHLFTGYSNNKLEVSNNNKS